MTIELYTVLFSGEKGPVLTTGHLHMTKSAAGGEGR